MKIIGTAIVLVALLYVLYVVIMRYKAKYEKRGYLHWYEWAFIAPMVAVGYPLDVALNWTVFIVVFLDAPREPTITERLHRYLFSGRYDGTWRYRLSRKLERLLERHDPDHLEP